MKHPVAVFQKLTLTLDQTRTQAKRIPGRTIDITKSLQEQQHQKESTQAMLVSELTAIGAAIEEMQNQTERDLEQNHRAVQVYQESMQIDGRGLASSLDEIQAELDALGANLRQNLNTQSQEIQHFDEIDVQSDQRRIAHLANYQSALHACSDLSGRTSDNLKVGQRSLAVELDTQQTVDHQLNSSLARVANQQAACQMAEGHPTAAVEALKQAVQLEPGDADLWFNLARLLIESGDAESAEEAFAQAVYLAPSSERVNRVGGWVAMRSGNLEEAIERFYKALQSELPVLEKLELLEGLAEAEYRVGRPDQAKQAWERVLEIDPYHPTAKRSVEWIG